MKKFGIFFLQEVHCTKEKERLWSSEWGFSAIFSSVSSSSAGVCILFNNNFQFEIKKQFSDPDGRFILVDLKLENKTITLGNIYAPNDDNPNFFKNVLSHLLSFECEDIILGGDFNLVLDVQNDKKGGRLTTHKSSLKEVQNIINSLDLIDIWRVSNPDIKRFTGRRSKPENSEYINLIKTAITEVANEYQNNTEVDALLLLQSQLNTQNIREAK